jgi:hypothetical protein
MESRKPEMRNQKPASRNFKGAGGLPLIGFGFSIFCCLVSIFLLPSSIARAEAGTAVVVGAERLFVRRGPGTEFPPFATLTKGDTVEVQEMQGEWARIMTGGGQTGYVRSNFLVLPGERERPAAPPLISPTPAQKPQPSATEPSALRATTARNKALETEIRNLQQEITALRSRSEVTRVSGTPASVAPAPVAPASLARAFLTPASVTPVATTPMTPPATATPLLAPAAGTDQLHAEIARLTAVVETLQHRLEARPPVEGLPAPGVPIDDTPHSWSSGALALGLIGVAIGWLAGSTLGRKSDRGRRSRIRF